MVTLGNVQTVPALAVPYLNRLSDLLFIAARALNRRAGVAEPQWQSPQKTSKNSQHHK